MRHKFARKEIESERERERERERRDPVYSYVSKKTRHMGAGAAAAIVGLLAYGIGAQGAAA